MSPVRRAHAGSAKAVWAALIGNVLVAVSKFTAALITGSSAMLSEAVHSFVDTSNEILLLYGMRRAARKPDRDHPFGHGREVYFWSFIVSLLIFALGAGFSFYEGIQHIANPEPMTSPLVNYVVLALSALFEGISWLVSWRQFRGAKNLASLFKTSRASKNPPAFITLFEDSAALLGIAVAAIAIAPAQILRMPVLDGVASILIALILASASLFLVRESKSLLMGEPADKSVRQSILALAREQEGIVQVNGLASAQLGPDQIIIMLSLEFADRLSAPDIERIVVDLENRIRESHPDVVAVFVKPQTPAMFRKLQARRLGNEAPAD
jgi:cation diffusion facilitator family transporter